MTDSHEEPRSRFIKVYEEHADSVLRFCLVKLSDREAALDVVQETFMRYWNTLQGGAQIDHERALLYTIARNLVIDRYRARRTDSLDRMMEDDGFEPADDHLRSPEDAADAARALALVAKLPEAYQEVIHLRYVEGLEPREIAELLGESANAVTVRIHRGLIKLRELFTASSQ